MVSFGPIKENLFFPDVSLIKVKELITLPLTLHKQAKEELFSSILSMSALICPCKKSLEPSPEILSSEKFFKKTNPLSFISLYYKHVMTTELDKRIKWQCRRGLWELDAILIPFSENHLLNLSEDQKLNLLELLKNEDIDLMDWIVTGVKSPDIFSGMITLILDKHLESI